MKKVLVTGGAGFIGANVAKLLLERNCKVTVLDDFSYANFRNISSLDVDVIAADITNQGLFNKLAKFDVVINEAAITDTTLKDDKLMLSVNYEGFKNVLSYCLKRKVKLVYISSAGVYGDGPSPMKEIQKPHPLNAYAYSKYLCDREAKKFFNYKKYPPIIGIRYFNVYGPGEYHKKSAASMIYQLYLQMKKGRRPRIFKYGQQKRDFIYVKDAARATVEAALRLNKSTIINVGTGKAESFNTIIKYLNLALGKKLQPFYFDNPYQGLYQDFTQAGITRLKNILHFTPAYSLKKGIADYVKNHLEKEDV